MPVFSEFGGKGQIVDARILAELEAIKEAIKNGFSVPAERQASNDWLSALNWLIDLSQPTRVRLKAAEVLGDIGELDAIEPLRNLKSGNEMPAREVERAVQKIHTKFFSRGCPFCAEIIKKRAKICKHCGMEVAGK